MYKDVKRAVKVKSYTSVSELIRAAVRKILYEEITENGFTPDFENQVLEAEMEPEGNDTVLGTPEEVRNYFKHLKKPGLSHAQNKEHRTFWQRI